MLPAVNFMYTIYTMSTLRTRFEYTMHRIKTSFTLCIDVDLKLYLPYVQLMCILCTENRVKTLFTLLTVNVHYVHFKMYICSD